MGYKVRTQSHLHTENARITPDKCTCIHFYNQGEDACYVEDKRLDKGTSLEINYDPGTIIVTSYELRFEHKEQDRQVVVTRTFFENA